jgi:hypothetical protein
LNSLKLRNMPTALFEPDQTITKEKASELYMATVRAIAAKEAQKEASKIASHKKREAVETKLMGLDTEQQINHMIDGRIAKVVGTKPKGLGSNVNYTKLYLKAPINDVLPKNEFAPVTTSPVVPAKGKGKGKKQKPKGADVPKGKGRGKGKGKGTPPLGNPNGKGTSKGKGEGKGKSKGKNKGKVKFPNPHSPKQMKGKGKGKGA